MCIVCQFVYPVPPIVLYLCKFLRLRLAAHHLDVFPYLFTFPLMSLSFLNKDIPHISWVQFPHTGYFCGFYKWTRWNAFPVWLRGRRIAGSHCLVSCRLSTSVTSSVHACSPDIAGGDSRPNAMVCVLFIFLCRFPAPDAESVRSGRARSACSCGWAWWCQLLERGASLCPLVCKHLITFIYEPKWPLHFIYSLPLLIW